MLVVDMSKPIKPLKTMPFPLTDALGGKPRLAIIPFQIKGNIPQQEQQAGDILSELLLAEIDTQDYELFERSQLQALIVEQKFQASDLIDNATQAAHFGRLAGIKYLVMGTLSRLGTQYHMTARVVDCNTGQLGERGAVTFDNINEAARNLPQLVKLLGLRNEPITKPADENQISDTASDFASPQRIQKLDLISATNPDTDFGITVLTAQKDAQGNSRVIFVEGDTLSFTVQTQRDCYITMLTRDPSGAVTVLLPNRWQSNTFVRGGEVLEIPSK